MDSPPEFTTPTVAEGETVRKYLEIETEYMAAPGFFTHSPNALIRSQAVSIIATHSQTVDPDAFIPYLAMNYFDRYFSTVQFQDVQDVERDLEKVRLIALCCLFISTKMRLKTLTVDQFLRDKSLKFTQRRIMELELKILDVLSWRMRPVTPFLYLNYYYRYFKSLGGFKRRCINEIIVQAQGENQFVHFKPSQIAMLAFLAAAQIAYPSNEIADYQEEEEDLSECVRAFGDLCRRKNIKIEPQVKSQEVEDEDSSEEVENEHSSEEVEEDEIEQLFRQDKGKEVVLAHEAGTAQAEAEEPPSDEQIASITDEIGNKTHHRRGKSCENELLIRCAGDPSSDELLTILIEKNDRKTLSSEGLLEREQKVAEEDIVEITAEEKRRLAKGKAVVVSETSNEEERRLAKGKAVVVSETSDEEERRLAKGKAVAGSESSDEERQPPKSILEEQNENLDKEEQEILVAIEAAIKLGMGMHKVDKGAKVGESSELQIVEKLMNFDLKWATDVPLLDSGEPLTVIVQTSPVEVQGNATSNANNKVGCANCSIL